MAQGQKSIAQQIREARGLEPEKNPKKAEAGRKGAITTNAKVKGVSVDDERNRLSRQTKNRQITTQRQNGALNDQLAANLQKIQQIKKDAAVNYIRENVERVSKRLVKLALGQDEFKEAPASVQRLAMLDVLNIAGISAETTGQEKEQKKVSDLNPTELIALIADAKALMQKGKDQAMAEAIDVTPERVDEP